MLVIACSPAGPQNPLGPTRREEIAAIEDKGGRAYVVEADADSLRAFGTNPLDARTSGPAYAAGRAQAGAVLASVREFWAPEPGSATGPGVDPSSTGRGDVVRW